MYDTVFYFYNINSIGGIETFFYQIAKRFKDKDITIFYNQGNEKQIERLKQYVKVVQYKGEKIKCNKIYYNLNINIIDNVIANEHIQIMHGDYKALDSTPPMHKKIKRRISVSEVVQKSLKEISNIESEVIYNPYEVEKPKKLLRLISATRLTREKGLERIKLLVKELEKKNIPFLWLIFTDCDKNIDSDNIVFLKPKLDILDYIADSNYLVQLSDTEGFCYSVVEALSVGTPVITTDIPIIKEIGINENNSFVLNLDMSNLDVAEIYKRAGAFNFEYTPPTSKWNKEITAKKSNYQEEIKMRYKVVANEKWEEFGLINTDTKTIPKEDEKWEVNKMRLDVLLGNNSFNTNFIKSYEIIEDKELTISELKSIAKNNGIKGYTKMSKKDLEKALIDKKGD